MTSENLEAGLKERGFVGIEGMDSMGECHKDELHYILRTDGLIIYSNIPFCSDVKHYSESVCVSWVQDPFDDEIEQNEFTFEKLDEILKV